MDNNSNVNISKFEEPVSEGTDSNSSFYSGNQGQENNEREHRRDLEKARDRDWNSDNSHSKRKKYGDYEDKISRVTDSSHIQDATSSSYSYNVLDSSTLNIVSKNPLWNFNPISRLTVRPNNIINQNSPAITQPDNVHASGSGVNSFAFMTMLAENMFGVAGVGNYCQYGMPLQGNTLFPTVKEIVKLTKSVLYPPNPNAPRPTTREKPLGCKTVFVGGLPEKATEEIIKEIFDRCGTVETIRMSKKKFCHIRFSNELFVENAIYFSGYRLKIENKDEASFTGRLHVDYAQARDDQYDYECKQRDIQRQAQNQEQVSYRSVTPPIVHCTDREASLICEKLKNEDTFSKAACILISWLERGECSKKNSSSFFSMIQSTHNHVSQLQVDKVKYEEQLNDAKKKLKKQLERIIHQFTEIEKIYKAASLPKCWDHFTKAQRKNIEIWKKQTEEIKNAHVEEVINEREDEEMELSDEENDDNKKHLDVELLKNQCEQDINKLREETDSLKCQLEAVQNEIMVLQSDHEEELKRRDSQLAVIKHALQSSKKELLIMSQQHTKHETELKELRSFKCGRRNDDTDVDNDLMLDGNDIGLASGISSSSSSLENEARLIGLISTFLHVHPFGANIDYICSYLQQIDSAIRIRDVENLMKKYPTIFREDSTGIGASLGKKWFFIGFQI